MNWILLSFGAAFFTAMTTILAKIGIKDVNSNFATAYRTSIVIICSLVICLISESIYAFSTLNTKNRIYLVLSGVSTGLSWIFYYKALKLGDVNKVAPIDKSSFILSSLLFIIFFFDDTTHNGDPLTIGMIILSIVLMGVGTMLMIDKKKGTEIKSSLWLLYAILSAIFASLVSLFTKIGLKGIPSDLGTFIRTIIVFIFASAIVLVKKDYKGAKNITQKSWIFLTLSGLATGGAWLTEYYALNYVNSNPIAINAIGKLSILLTMLFSFFILKEKFSIKSIVGLGFLVSGIVVVILFSL